MVCLPKAGENAALFEANGLEPDFLDVPGRLVEGLVAWRIRYTFGIQVRLFRLALNYLSARKPDLVHVNDSTTALSWASAAKYLGVPVIQHIRMEAPGKLDRLTLFLSDYLIFVAAANRVRFQGRENLPASSVIYNPVNFAEFYPPEDRASYKARFELDPGKLTIGFVGNLAPRKRPEWAVQAAIDLLGQGREVQLVVVGKDKKYGYLPRLRKMVRDAGVSSHIHFLGARNDVPDLMRSFDILLLTSQVRGEAFPRAVIEAMASGVAVVATRVAGVPEAISDGVTGLLTDPHDYRDLVRAINSLIKDGPARQAMADRAFCDARERFSVERCGERTLEVYQEVLSRRAQRGRRRITS